MQEQLNTGPGGPQRVVFTSTGGGFFTRLLVLAAVVALALLLIALAVVLIPLIIIVGLVVILYARAKRLWRNLTTGKGTDHEDGRKNVRVIRRE